MILKKYPIKIAIVLVVIAITAIGISIVHRQLSNKRSALSHMARSRKGESYTEQKAKDLAEDLRSIPALAQLQPWALETMARFRARQVRGYTGSHLYWASDVFSLAPEETPEFIKRQLGGTDKFGEKWPLISIVLSNSQPNYIVIDWLGWGIAVGPPEYRLSFNITGTFEVAPGVYTYFGEK